MLEGAKAIKGKAMSTYKITVIDAGDLLDGLHHLHECLERDNVPWTWGDCDYSLVDVWDFYNYFANADRDEEVREEFDEQLDRLGDRIQAETSPPTYVNLEPPE